MALPRVNRQQKDFTAGQVSEAAAQRDDNRLVQKGLRTGTNSRVVNSGALENRFGRSAFMLTGGRTEKIRFTSDAEWYLTFTDGQVQIRTSAGAVDTTFTGLPWTTATLDDIQFAVIENDRVFITYPGNRPIVLRYGKTFTIPGAAGTAFGDMTAGGGVSAAFDGLTEQDSSDAAAKASATNGYVGLNFGNETRALSSAVVHPATDIGFFGGGYTGTTTVYMYGGNSTPASGTDGTELGNVTVNDRSWINAEITSNDDSTQYQYLWSYLTKNTGGAAIMGVAEVQLVTTTAEPTVSDDHWILEQFDFSVTASGQKRQPYYRFAPKGVTMTPTERTGNSTITFSEPVLDDAHVGVSFRYHEREMVIDTVVDSITAYATVVEKLPPTRNIVVEETDGFFVGQVVIGQTSQATALIVSIVDATNMHVVIYKGDKFFYDATATTGERITSETGSTRINSGTQTEQTEAASAVWDEAAMSDVRGWPRSCMYDRGRLALADFPAIPNGVAWSAIGAYDDMKVGAEAADGMFETIGASVRIRHLIGGDDQFILTDSGPWYIPISAANPLRPGGIDFRRIGEIGCSDVAPKKTVQGILYTSANGKSLMAIVPTGQSAFPYRLVNTSEYHADLISSPIAIAVMSSGNTEPEQYIWVLNSAGTLCVGRFDQGNEWIGFVPVTGTGTVKWVSALGSEVLFDTYYAGTTPVTLVEQLDPAQYVDCGVTLNSPSSLLDGGSGPLWFLAGLDVDLMYSHAYLGTRLVDANGNITTQVGDDFSNESIVAGFGWTSTVTPFVPNVPEGAAQGQRTRRRRVTTATITVQDTTEFDFGGRTFGAYETVDPGEDPPPLRDGTYRARPPGRSYDPQISFVKSVPGPYRITLFGFDVTV